MTVQVLSEVAKAQVERERELTVEPLETKMPKPKIIIRETGGGGVHFTGSVRVVGCDNESSWC